MLPKPHRGVPAGDAESGPWRTRGGEPVGDDRPSRGIPVGTTPIPESCAVIDQVP